MLHFPGDFGCFDLLQCTADKQSTISVKGCHYSVPDHLAGKSVIVQLYSEKIRVYDSAHKKVAEHERSYSNGSWTFDINHYINTLMKKPGALKGSIALRQMPDKMRELFRVHFEDNGKDFLWLSLAKSKERVIVLVSEFHFPSESAPLSQFVILILIPSCFATLSRIVRVLRESLFEVSPSSSPPLLLPLFASFSMPFFFFFFAKIQYYPVCCSYYPEHLTFLRFPGCCRGIIKNL